MIKPNNWKRIELWICFTRYLNMFVQLLFKFGLWFTSKHRFCMLYIQQWTNVDASNIYIDYFKKICTMSTKLNKSTIIKALKTFFLFMYKLPKKIIWIYITCWIADASDKKKHSVFCIRISNLKKSSHKLFKRKTNYLDSLNHSAHTHTLWIIANNIESNTLNLRAVFDLVSLVMFLLWYAHKSDRIKQRNVTNYFEINVRKADSIYLKQ